MADTNHRGAKLFEVLPVAAVSLLLFAKLLFFGLTTHGLWPSQPESTGRWILDRPEYLSTTLASLLVLIAPTLMLPRTWRLIVLLLLDALVSAVLVVDLVHVNHYGAILSMADLSRAAHLRWVLPSVAALIKPIHFLFFLDVAAGLILLPFYIRHGQRRKKVKAWKRARWSTVLILLGALMAIPSIHLSWEDEGGTLTYANLQREISARLGPVVYHIVDAAIHMGSERAQGNREEIERFLRRKGREHSRSTSLHGVARGKNVIFISAESLQAFVLGLTVKGQAITPNLSALAMESLHFDRFYDQTHLGTTSDSELAALCSLYPLATSLVAHDHASNHFRCLPSILGERGYHTLSAAGQPGQVWYMSKMHPALGFAHSYFEDSFKITERIGSWLSDQAFFDQVISRIEQTTEPFFAYLLTSTSHHPYELPQRHQHLSLGGLEGTELGRYLHAVHYLDLSIGKFVSHLRKSGLYDRTLLILYGDHQAFLKDEAGVSRLTNLRPKSEVDRWLVRKRLPLLVRLPWARAAGTRNVTGGHLDIAPTILDLLGIDRGGEVMLSRSLLENINSPIVFRDGSFIDDKHLFINRYGPIDASRCYLLKSKIPIPCAGLRGQRRKALEQLRVSDAIIRGDLVPSLFKGRQAPSDVPDRYPDKI